MSLGWGMLLVISEMSELSLSTWKTHNDHNKKGKWNKGIKKKKTLPNNLTCFILSLLRTAGSSLHSMATKGHRQDLTSSCVPMTRKVPSAFWAENPKSSVQPSWFPGLFFWTQSFWVSNWIRGAAVACEYFETKDAMRFSRLVGPAVSATQQLHHRGLNQVIERGDHVLPVKFLRYQP